MLEQRDVFVLQARLVALDDFATAREQRRVAAELRESDGCLDVGHVAFPSGERDVVFPGAGAVLGERVFRLAVKRHEHDLLVGFLIVEEARPPGERAAFSGGEVLDGMERERRQIGGLPRALALPHGAERMRPVCEDWQTVEALLRLVGGLPAIGDAFERLEKRVVVDHAACDIDGDDGARALVHEARELGVVHLERVRGDIAEHGSGAYVADA